MNPATLVPILLVLAAGAMVALQAPTNAILARAGGSPVFAALISFAVGTIALVLVWLASGSRAEAQGFARLPWYAWLGGLYGATYVTIAAFAAPRIGLASLITIGIAGQIISAMVLDHFGVLGLPKDPFSLVRLTGAALVVVGVVLVRRG